MNQEHPRSLSELKNSSKYDFFELDVEHEEDEPFNISLQNVAPGVIMVTNISSVSILMGALQIGDYILTVNNKSFKDKEEFFQHAIRIWPNMKLVVARLKTSQSLSSSTASQSSRSSGGSSASIKSQTDSQEEPDPNSPSSKSFERVASAEELKNTDKFLHLEIVLEKEQEESLNIELENVANGVILVTKVSAFSFLFGMVRSGDYILNVNGKSFKNKQEFLSYCSRALPEFKLTVARRKDLVTDEKKPSVPVKEEKRPIASLTEDKKPIASLPLPTVPSKPSQVAASSSSPTSSSPTSGSGQTPGSPSAGSWSPSSAAQNLVDLLKSAFGKSSPSSAPLIPTSDKSPVVETKGPPVFNELFSFDGSTINPNKEYKFFRIAGSKSKQHLGLEIKATPKDNTVIIVHGIQTNSISSNVFKLGDRILFINGNKITDLDKCANLIETSSGDFEVFLERPPKGLLEYGIMTAAPAPWIPPAIPKKPARPAKAPLKSSYRPPDEDDPDEYLGDPLCTYIVAPTDVQTALNRQIPRIEDAFMAKEKRPSKIATVRKDDKISIDTDITEHDITSDVKPEKQLRKPPKQ